MKCGVCTSIQVSGLSAGAGLPQTAMPGSREITDSNRVRKYRLGDITKCVSQQLGVCQDDERSGAFVYFAGLCSERIDPHQGKSRSSTVWISPSHFFSDTS